MFGIWTSILSIFVGLSIGGAIGLRYFELQKNQFKEYVSSCIFILIITTFILILFIYLFIPLFVEMLSIPRYWLLAGVFVSSLQFILAIRLSIWQVTNKSFKYAAFQVAQAFLNACLSMWFIFASGLSWEGRLFAISLTIIVAFAYASISLFREGWIDKRVNFNYIVDALKFGIPLIPHLLGGVVFVTIDRMMISKMIGMDAAGIYALAIQIGMVLNLVTLGVNQAYFPWLRRELDRRERATNCMIIKNTYFYYLILITLALLIGFFSSNILSVIVGPQFRQAENLVLYISMGYAFGGMYYMVTNYVFISGSTIMLSLNTFVVGLINIALAFVLIKKNGIVGAAQAFMWSQALLFIGTWIIASRKYPMPWFDFYKKKVLVL